MTWQCVMCLGLHWFQLRLAIRPVPNQRHRRVHFFNGFSIAIQIRWKFHFSLTPILITWSLQNFEHAMTAQLSWHVQNIVAIWWPLMELQKNVEFELRWNTRSLNVPFIGKNKIPSATTNHARNVHECTQCIQSWINVWITEWICRKFMDVWKVNHEGEINLILVWSRF